MEHPALEGAAGVAGRWAASHAPRSMQGTVCCSALHQWWHVVSAAWLAWRQQHMILQHTGSCLKSWASSAGCVCLHRRAAVAVPATPAQRLLPAGPQLQVLLLQANRVRGVLITQMYSFFDGNGIDVLLAPSIDYTSVGNLVGLPEAVVPIGFKPVSPGSPRQNPSTIGIYGLPYQDAKARQLPDACSCPPVHCCQLCCAAARKVCFFCGLPCCCGFASEQHCKRKAHVAADPVQVLAIAMAFQSVTSFHLQQPPINQVEPFVLQTCLQYSKCDQYAFPNATVPNITL